MSRPSFSLLWSDLVVEARHLDQVRTRPLPTLSTDSRTVEPGQVFVALRGERFDGHAFVEAALARGVAACLVDRRWARREGTRFPDAPLLVVEDTRRAYGRVARALRDMYQPQVVAVTGSNGKTSTRMMIGAVLGRRGVLQTEGNFNNQIGLPATLLRLRPSDRIAVVEIGTNQPGDIAELCEIAAPTHGVITNIGRAHIERLLNREGIAQEKGALLRSLPKDGVAIINADEPLLRSQLRRGQRAVRFGQARHADVRILDIHLDAQARPTVEYSIPSLQAEPIRVTLNGRGRHVAWNAAAALAVGLCFERPLDTMVTAVRRFRHGDGRMEIETVHGITVINDTYNANPDSVLAALDTLQALHAEGEKIVVLGDMLELGSQARQEHEAIGRALVERGLRYVLTHGRHAAHIHAMLKGQSGAAHFRTMADVCQAVQALAMPGDLVLVKGSRGMHMEQVVSALREESASSEGGR